VHLSQVWAKKLRNRGMVQPEPRRLIHTDGRRMPRLYSLVDDSPWTEPIGADATRPHCEPQSGACWAWSRCDGRAPNLTSYTAEKRSCKASGCS
jgi:hypothetical protein